MSTYEWESGTIKFSCKEWRKFKQTIRDKYNERQVSRFNRAQTVHAQLIAAGKGHRNFNFKEAFEKIFEREDDYSERNAIYRSLFEDKVPMTLAEKQEAQKYSSQKRTDAELEALKLFKSEKRQKPRKAKKNDFEMAGRDKVRYGNGEGAFTFDDKTRCVHWDVPENNHACERAHESYMGNVFFRALEQVVWTRGTGGEIVGNDEYNRESESSGGGANYTKQRFGPKSKEDRRQFARSW